MPKVVDESGATVFECPYDESGEVKCMSVASTHPGWRVVRDTGKGSRVGPLKGGAGSSGQPVPGTAPEDGMYGPETRGLRSAVRNGRRGPRVINGSR